MRTIEFCFEAPKAIGETFTTPIGPGEAEGWRVVSEFTPDAADWRRYGYLCESIPIEDAMPFEARFNTYRASTLPREAVESLKAWFGGRWTVTWLEDEETHLIEGRDLSAETKQKAHYFLIGFKHGAGGLTMRDCKREED